MRDLIVWDLIVWDLIVWDLIVWDLIVRDPLAPIRLASAPGPTPVRPGAPGLRTRGWTSPRCGP